MTDGHDELDYAGGGLKQETNWWGAFVIGLAITRYVLVNPPVAGLSREELSRWAAPVIKQLLVGPAPA